MKGSEAKMISFMEGADKRYVIPVYQRKYDWKYENCQQLYNDLKKIVIDERDSHFFGSIVSAVVPNGSKIEYHIIDGQQRLTTITLLLLAIRNLIAQGKVMTDEGKLDVKLMGRGYAWLDTGTHDSMMEAASFIATIQKRQNLKVACLEEIAYRMGYISKEKLVELAQPMKKNDYGQYLLRLAKEQQ